MSQTTRLYNWVNWRLTALLLKRPKTDCSSKRTLLHGDVNGVPRGTALGPLLLVVALSDLRLVTQISAFTSKADDP